MNEDTIKLSLIGKIKAFFSKFTDPLQYKLENSRNHYRCKLIGEKPNPKDQYNTVILYRMYGKRVVFEITIKDLLENRNLLEQFHPTEAVKFGAIAMGDTIFNENPDLIKQKFQEIKQKMLEEV